LHVLGLPPAFALSQDQTLKLDENFSRLITTFDEVPPLVRARSSVRAIVHRTPACRFHDKGVDLKRRPPKSRPAAPPLEDRSSIEDTARRDSAVHVSLSSDSPIKQPGTKAVPPSGEPESRRSPRASDRDRKPGHRISMRSFEDAPSHRGGGVPNDQYIGVQPHKCQHPGGQKSTLPVPPGNSRLRK
jgi:hypothetical protein